MVTTIKAHEIFEEDEKDIAEAYLDDKIHYHPRLKMFHLCSNSRKGVHGSGSNGGWVITGRKAMFYETKHREGFLI